VITEVFFWRSSGGWALGSLSGIRGWAPRREGEEKGRRGE